MGDQIFFNVTELRQTARQIATETSELRGVTSRLLGQIDSTSQQLPPPAYEYSQSNMTRVRAFLERSMEIRDRISTLLKVTADTAEQLDRQMAQVFNEASQP
jgi:uncharacterized protein YukE